MNKAQHLGLKQAAIFMWAKHVNWPVIYKFSPFDIVSILKLIPLNLI